jgi:energy-coupling factor transporter ATP-binding protein EcfA2
MITKVVAKNFKGRDFEIEIGAKTLICGPNGTGKSAIVQALELAINGHVSGGTYKTNAAILEAFGRNDKLTVEASIKTAGNGSTQLARQFSMDAKGSVSQIFLVDRRRSDQKAFMAAAGAAGAPKVVVVDDFLQLSPAKMISYLAAFTGGQEIEQLASQIVTETDKLNKVRAEIRENESYISRTMAGIADLSLPAGTLAEIQASIKVATKELAKAKADLKEAEKAEADRLAQEEKRKAEPAAAPLSAHSPDKGEPGYRPPIVAGNSLGKVLEAIDALPEYREPVQAVVYPTQEEQFGPPQEKWRPHQGLTPLSSLKKILDAIDALECPVCKSGFVRLVVLNEMKKWEGK